MGKRQKPEIQERLSHILAAIDDIFAFTSDMDFEDFVEDRKTRLAVEKLFEIIGEATYQLPADFKLAHREVEWKQMETTRHILVHNYYAVIPSILWNAKEVYLTDLHEKIRKLLTP
ncbi:DUF86 domain-containing protein [Neolewinella lacunae]|uniref:DUF86 domain-containing protein n=1 Tax=Neolewinella lacunae TaxID=1517758 RepID=A0A923T934_9BACT|nr:HepT-like ribonuclease domain-containing protein [Neolewinella lacunae]MBC6996295.1 DUF86 domain-containing protein [Neolewinella lacunae]MDN3636918.1 DUF86 domain-containing protein [Neolewinella lacunae]